MRNKRELLYTDREPTTSDFIESPQPGFAEQALTALPFDLFCNAVAAIMDRVAENKGYNVGGPNAPNQLDDFVEKHFNGHALGEVAYKLVRYRARQDPNDLIKAAAWIYLEWRRQHNANSIRSNRASCGTPPERSRL